MNIAGIAVNVGAHDLAFLVFDRRRERILRAIAISVAVGVALTEVDDAITISLASGGTLTEETQKMIIVSVKRGMSHLPVEASLVKTDREPEI